MRVVVQRVQCVVAGPQGFFQDSGFLFGEICCPITCWDEIDEDVRKKFRDLFFAFEVFQLDDLVSKIFDGCDGRICDKQLKASFVFCEEGFTRGTCTSWTR